MQQGETLATDVFNIYLKIPVTFTRIDFYKSRGIKSETYLILCQTSKRVFLKKKTLGSFNPIPIFAKSSILDI